jgi:hypothetical protein
LRVTRRTAIDARTREHDGRAVPVSSRAMTLVLLLAGAVACSDGSAPDLLGLTDQVAVVGQEFTLELEGVDPDGDRLSYSFQAESALAGRAMMTQTPRGTGVFRWTPLAADVGQHAFDFTVSDGSNTTTVTINIDVRATSQGVPRFIEPAGAGKAIDLSATPCVDLDIVVEDQDTPQVTITEEEPKIAGATLEQLDGTTAHWRWCPTASQAAETDRYTLVLGADDGEHMKVLKHYVLMLGAAGPAVVINEIDYDNTGLDEFEYVEIYNPYQKQMTLIGLYLVFVNGATSSEYNAVYLGDAVYLDPGEYLMVAGAGVDVAAPAIKLDPGWTTDAIQNGSPDGIAIIDDVLLTVVDAVSYEGSITAASIIGFSSPVSLVEGTALPLAVADSDTSIVTLCRLPNGGDTNDAATDWKTCSRTKGAANAP